MFGPSTLPRTLEAALRDLQSEKAQVRAEAARDLAPYAGTARAQVVRALEGALRDADARVRGAAALALSDVQADEALPSLLFTIEDDDVYVRQMAILALGEIGDARAAQRLSRALSDERAEVRFQAVMAFPRVCRDTADAEEALLTATMDRDDKVVHIALRMMEELGAHRDEQGREHGVSAEVLSRAFALLSHASPSVRLAAAILLSRADAASSARQAAHDVIVRAVQRDLSTDDPEDEAAAVELCGEHRLREAIPALERRAFGVVLGLGRDRFAWNARVSLAQMGHEKAIREIVRELSGWNRDRRTLAAAAAGRARIEAARPILMAMRGDSGKADPDTVISALRLIDGLDETDGDGDDVRESAR